MADIPSWLKNFQRIRTPIIAGSPKIERGSLFEDTNGNEDEMTIGPRNIPRVSSYLNLGRQKPPSTSSYLGPGAQLPSAVEVWHNPDETQVVETLKVLLTNHNTFEPIPVQYNSCVLQVLEAYASMRGAVKERERDLRSLEVEQIKKAAEFKELFERSMEMENNYKQEIKNLEIMLAAGARGLDVVTMARSKSLVYKSEIKTQLVGCSPISTDENIDFATKKDRTVSDKFLLQQRATNGWRHFSGQLYQQTRYGNTVGGSSFDPKCESVGKSHGLWETKNRKYSLQKSRESRWFGSTMSDSQDTAPAEVARHAASKHSSVGRKACVGTDSKTLPKSLSNSKKEEMGASHEAEIVSFHNRQDENMPLLPSGRTRGFSFLPGDDHGTLPTGPSTRRETLYELNSCSIENNQVSKTPRPKNSAGPAVEKTIKKGNQPHMPAPTPSFPETSSYSDQMREYKGFSSLDRSSQSQGSNTAAVGVACMPRYKTSRSICQARSETERLRLNCQNAQNEATIAAVRAINGNEKKIS